MVKAIYMEISHNLTAGPPPTPPEKRNAKNTVCVRYMK